ncbi:MAG: hypothetical protein QS721_00770 [Candidatus Endonucleobacter sp. (ex Gigantidas childressi)]|nr:hypothetical protein [Candidatus Endonucleobacter sp. (ex Gigantidas childressi)]
MIKVNETVNTFLRRIDIPVAFQSATLLAAFAHPDHLLLVGSQGLPPSSNLKSFGCIPIAFQSATLLTAFAHPDHLLL